MGRDGFMNVRPYGYGEQSQSGSPVYIRALRHPTTLPCAPCPIHTPPLPLRYKVLASTLYTTPPPEPDTHIIPGRRKKNPGSSGRGAIMFTLAYTSLTSRVSSRAPPNGGEYSNGWVICQHKSWKTCFKNTAGSIRAAFSPRE